MTTSNSTRTAELRLEEVARIPFAVSTMHQAVEWLVDRIQAARPVSVRFANAWSVVSAHRDPDYLGTMRSGGVSFPDGAPVAVALRVLRGARDARRVRGPSFFVEALGRTSTTPIRHYFLGTSADTLSAMTSTIGARWPELQVAGAYGPPMGPITDVRVEEWARRIEATGAQCVWIAFGTPKQDVLAARLAARLGVPCVAVGAAFDFLAGTKAEAPRWMQRGGVEWVFRLLSEPGRLWRRYLIGNVRFLILVATGEGRGASMPRR